jgi:hypothetical protein
MKLVNLFEREENFAAQGYGFRRKQLIAAIAHSTGDQEKLEDPNYLMTMAKSLLSRPPYHDWSEKEQRRMLADIMDAFGIMPPDQNQSVFKRL